MKTKNFRTVLLGALLSVAAATAFAATTGTGTPKDPAPFGKYVGIYKFIQPHQGRDGMYYTYTYVTVTGTTQEYCQQQIPNNVPVVQWCQLT